MVGNLFKKVRNFTVLVIPQLLNVIPRLLIVIPRLDRGI
jgi:hypothetical protein